MQVFTFGDKNAKNTILFIHGGAYVMELNYQHFFKSLKVFKKVTEVK